MTAQSERPGGEPAANLVKAINAPERLTVDDDIRGTEHAKLDRRVNFVFQLVLDRGIVERGEYLVAFQPSVAATSAVVSGLEMSRSCAKYA